MIKAILFDLDGVVVKRHEYFSVSYAREHNVPLDDVVAFFKNDFAACSLGKADLKEALAPHLAAWKWSGTVDELLTYWFESENHPDADVLERVRVLRAEGTPCFLASEQEQYRAAYLLEDMGMKTHFDGAFFSCELGASKSEPVFFQKALAKLGLPASEVAYFDDDAENVAVAATLGIQACYYTKLEDIDAFLRPA
jgi:putative hydrolase of the HAD superfamily